LISEKRTPPDDPAQPGSGNVGVVAATLRSLADLVEQGHFRRDLFYRMNVVRLAIRPLREQRENALLLVQHFIFRFNRLRGKEILGVSPAAMGILLNHEFPGNVRELENIIEQAFVLCRGPMIDVGCLPDFLRRKQATVAAPATEGQGLAAIASRPIKARRSGVR